MGQKLTTENVFIRIMQKKFANITKFFQTKYFNLLLESVFEVKKISQLMLLMEQDTLIFSLVMKYVLF